MESHFKENIFEIGQIFSLKWLILLYSANNIVNIYIFTEITKYYKQSLVYTNVTKIKYIYKVT